jgi:predicted membrane protein
MDITRKRLKYLIYIASSVLGTTCGIIGILFSIYAMVYGLTTLTLEFWQIYVVCILFATTFICAIIANITDDKIPKWMKN